MKKFISTSNKDQNISEAIKAHVENVTRLKTDLDVAMLMKDSSNSDVRTEIANYLDLESLVKFTAVSKNSAAIAGSNKMYTRYGLSEKPTLPVGVRIQEYIQRNPLWYIKDVTSLEKAPEIQKLIQHLIERHNIPHDQIHRIGLDNKIPRILSDKHTVLIHTTHSKTGEPHVFHINTIVQ